MAGLSFSMADIYGPNFGYSTTRLTTVPEENDQDALSDSTTASADVHTEPAAKRNMVIFLVVAIAIVVLFSVNW